MVQMRVQRKGIDLNKEAEKFKVNVEDLKEGVLRGLAGEVAVRSPLDSGTYARNHEVALRSGSYQSNAVRARGAKRISDGGTAQYPNAREEGLSNMNEDINGLDLTSENFVIRNPMAYAPLIEAGITGNKTGAPPVYASAAREGSRIIQEVVQMLKSRSR